MADQTPAGPLKTPLEAPATDSKPAPKPALTDDLEGKYEALLGRVKSFTDITCAKDKSKSGPLTDRERLWLTRECLLRYLRATKWSVDESARRLMSTLAWRREYGLDDFTAEYISPEQETGKQIIVGFDRLGRPCQYLNPGRQNTDTSPRQIHHLFYMVERVADMMPPGVETLSLLINFKPSKQRQNTSVPITTAREVLNILQTHYPERLGKALIINVPWLVTGFFKIIQTFLDPVTREKLKFNKDMKQYVPPEQLWSADWGGDMDFEYDHSVYWPALHDMCRRRREQRTARWEAAGKEIGESEEYLAGGTDLSVTGFRYDGPRLAAGGSKPAVNGADEKPAGAKLNGAAARESNEDTKGAAALNTKVNGVDEKPAGAKVHKAAAGETNNVAAALKAVAEVVNEKLDHATAEEKNKFATALKTVADVVNEKLDDAAAEEKHKVAAALKTVADVVDEKLASARLNGTKDTKVAAALATNGDVVNKKLDSAAAEEISHETKIAAALAVVHKKLDNVAGEETGQETKIAAALATNANVVREKMMAANLDDAAAGELSKVVAALKTVADYVDETVAAAQVDNTATTEETIKDPQVVAGAA